MGDEESKIKELIEEEKILSKNETQEKWAAVRKKQKNIDNQIRELKNKILAREAKSLTGAISAEEAKERSNPALSVAYAPSAEVMPEEIREKEKQRMKLDEKNARRGKNVDVDQFRIQWNEEYDAKLSKLKEKFSNRIYEDAAEKDNDKIEIDKLEDIKSARLKSAESERAYKDATSEDEQKAFIENLNLSKLGTALHDEKTLDEFQKNKMKVHKLMIDCWNLVVGLDNNFGLDNTFDNYIFFATIIWPQVDPRREYTGCEKYNKEIITTFTDDQYLLIKTPNNEEGMSYFDKYIEDTNQMVKENNEKEWGDLSRTEKYNYLPIYERVESEKLKPDEKVESENNFRQNVLPAKMIADFKQNIASCINPDFNGYKENFITTIGNIDSITNELNNLCIQYLKNTNKAAYDPNFKLTSEHLKDFFYNNLSLFLEHFKPDAFEIAMSVARKNELFLDEIFQQTYVEEYINNLFNNGNLVDISNSKSPTIDEINTIMPGVFMKGGLGIMDVLGTAATKRLEAEDASYKKNYENAFFNIKIQLRMLFDSFRKEVVSPKIKEVLEQRTSIINEESSSISSQKTAKMQADIDAKNKEKDARNKDKTTKRDALIREKEEYSVKKQDLLTQLNAFKEVFSKSPMQLKNVDTNFTQIKTLINNLNANLKEFKTSSIENIIKDVKEINNKINAIKSRKTERSPAPIYSLDKTKKTKHEIENTKNAIKLFKKEIEDLNNRKSDEDNAPNMNKINTIIAKIGKDTNLDGSPTPAGLRNLNPTELAAWNQYKIYNSNKTKIPDEIAKIKTKMQTKIEELDGLSSNMIVHQLEERQMETKKLKEEEISLTGDLDSKRNEIIGLIQEDINGIDVLIPEKPEVISDALEEIETLPGVDSETVNLSQEEIENSEAIKTKITNYVANVLDITPDFVEVTVNAIIKKNVIEIFVNLFPEELIKNNIYIERYNTVKTKYTDAIGDNTEKRKFSDAYKEASESNSLTTQIRETKLAEIEAQKKIKAEAEAKRLAEAAARAKEREEKEAERIRQQAEEAAARAKQKAEEAAARAKKQAEDEAERTKQKAMTDLEKKRKELEAAESKLNAVKGISAVPPKSAISSMSAPSGAARPGTSVPAGEARPPPTGAVRPPPTGAVRPPPTGAVRPPPTGAVRPGTSVQSSAVDGGNRKTPRSFRRSIKNNQKPRLHTSIKRFNNYKKNKNTKKNYMAYKPMSMPIGGKRTTRLSRMNSNKKINRRTRRSK